MIRTYIMAYAEALSLATKWGSTWAVCWWPTADGEGLYTAARAGIFPQNEIEQVTDPIPPDYLDSLWRRVEQIINPGRRY